MPRCAYADNRCFVRILTACRCDTMPSTAVSRTRRTPRKSTIELWSTQEDSRLQASLHTVRTMAASRCLGRIRRRRKEEWNRLPRRMYGGGSTTIRTTLIGRERSGSLPSGGSGAPVQYYVPSRVNNEQNSAQFSTLLRMLAHCSTKIPGPLSETTGAASGGALLAGKTCTGSRFWLIKFFISPETGRSASVESKWALSFLLLPREGAGD